MPAKQNIFKFRHTTKKSPSETAGEIQVLLIQMGASNISTVTEECKAVSMTFTYNCDGQQLAFRLPIKWLPLFDREVRVFDAKKRSKPLGVEQRERSIVLMRKQAEMTGWRIALEWLRVQVAFVETGLRDVLEVFMADMFPPGRKETLSELLAERGAVALLPPPE